MIFFYTFNQKLDALNIFKEKLTQTIKIKLFGI